jgi:amino-acid N-acetyltransferase
VLRTTSAGLNPGLNTTSMGGSSDRSATISSNGNRVDASPRRSSRRSAATMSDVEASARKHVDPSLIEFASFQEFQNDDTSTNWEEELRASPECPYPFATMLQLSARYIADHAEAVSVFHIPGELFHNKESFRNLMNDLALAWLLGMKIVLVADCRYTKDCEVVINGNDAMIDSAHECHNSMRVTDSSTLRQIEEESGYMRFEIERLMNKRLRRHGSTGSADANVVGGNFFSATAFGEVRGVDYQHSGYPTGVQADKILQVLDNHDIVLLTTIGTSDDGDLVNVNGEHLAASVAAEIGAQKLVYMASQGAVLRQKGQSDPLQNVPLSLVQSILEYHQVHVYKIGVAAFEKAKQHLDSSAIELLLHFGWAAWAMEQGVRRAHIVNPSDGALLEELFTAEYGTNTCLYHDDEGKEDDTDDIARELDMFLQEVSGKQ